MTAPEPGSREWLRYMTASKIAAVVGTSPHESRFSLWHKMAGNVPSGHVTDNPIFNYGHYLEPVLLKWFADQHPELTVLKGSWQVERDAEWAAATPDGEFYRDGERMGPVEAKTARLSWEWENGVPPGYYDQVQWSMFVMDKPEAYVVADIAMEFREFHVPRDQARIDHLVTEGAAFMRSLETGDAPPLDGSMHTYQAVRELHPDISPEDAEIPDDLATEWIEAKYRVGLATADETRLKSEIADFMGNARRARWNDQTLFTRQAKSGGTPYLVAARTLPRIYKETAA